jgi:hypothetical protein
MGVSGLIQTVRSVQFLVNAAQQRDLREAMGTAGTPTALSLVLLSIRGTIGVQVRRGE